MKSVLLLFIVIGSYLNASAQFTFNKQWDKRFGGTLTDGFQAFQQTTDGGYILGGYSHSGISGDKSQANWDTTNFLSDYWVIKIDAAGNKQWDKRFGGTSLEVLGALQQTFDGGYILGGESPSGVNGDKSQPQWGGGDFWIVKTDTAGNKQWDKRYGGTLSETLNALIQTRDSGYIFGGYSDSPVSGDKTQGNWGTGNDDIWVVKVDKDGNKQWDKRFGGIQQDKISSITETKDGYLLAASSSSGISGDKTQTSWGGFDGWLVKIDSSGIKQWDKSYGGTDDDGISSVRETEDGGYILGIGSYSGISGNKTEDGKGYWMVKTDSTGQILWEKVYSQAYGFALLTKTIDNGYLLSGISASNSGEDKTENNLGPTEVWIVKTDSIGNIQWDKTIFTTKYCEGYAIQTTDGCYAVGAYTASGIGGYKTQANWDNTEATYDYWIMKFCMDTVTGIDDRRETMDNRQITVYPNPFTIDLSISLKAHGVYPTNSGRGLRVAIFTITDLIGQTIYRREETNLANNYTKMLDLSYLPNGMYLLEVTIDGQRKVKQIIKQ